MAGAAGLDRGTWHFMTGLPYAFRLARGLRAPKTRSWAWIRPHRRRDRRPRRRFAAGDAVFGVSIGRAA